MTNSVCKKLTVVYICLDYSVNVDFTKNNRTAWFIFSPFCIWILSSYKPAAVVWLPCFIFGIFSSLLLMKWRMSATSYKLQLQVSGRKLLTGYMKCIQQQQVTHCWLSPHLLLAPPPPPSTPPPDMWSLPQDVTMVTDPFWAEVMFFLLYCVGSIQQLGWELLLSWSDGVKSVCVGVCVCVRGGRGSRLR